MVAEAEVVFQQSLPLVLDIDGVSSAVISPLSSPKLGIRRSPASVSGGLSTSPVLVSLNLSDMVYSRRMCSILVSRFMFRPYGQEATLIDIGPKRNMEDEHICVDDLSSQLNCLSELPNPTAFYAANANAGDCRAVLCRKGRAIELSHDHTPINPLERRRVEECGGVIEDGYLNGELSVTRALGDWDMKRTPHGSSSSKSPLISEPEIKQISLTEEDEFLVMGCDGIWDVLTSQEAVSIVKRGLNRHDDPARCARELVMEALRLNTFDNLTAVVVSFATTVVPLEKKKKQCFSLTPEALRSLRSLLDG
ncbi:putative protein phosphatase 2C 49 [Raphanus sativus]|nr:putative protein phosphatase 2C 49 [Raphanus sativus]